jgi:hypothetical protein
MINITRILHCGICHGRNSGLARDYDYCAHCGGQGSYVAVGFTTPAYLDVGQGSPYCHHEQCSKTRHAARFDPFGSRDPMVQVVSQKLVDWPTKIQRALATKARTTPELAAKFNSQGKHVLKRLHEARKKGLVTCSGIHPLTWRLVC